MSYDHTQKGWLSKVLNWFGVLTILDAIFFCYYFPATPKSLNIFVFFAVTGLGILLLVLARMFAQLRVRDTGSALDVRFGPLGNFGKSFPYSEISGLEPAQSTLLDGWGIHWLPGRGWIWNISGYDCVRFNMAGTVYRIGSDDRGNLLAFLKTKAGEKD